MAISLTRLPTTSSLSRSSLLFFFLSSPLLLYCILSEKIVWRSGLRKKTAKNKLIGQKLKKVEWLRLDEEMQPIPWTERPTGALVGAGSTVSSPRRSKQTMTRQMDDWTDGRMDDGTDGCTLCLMHMCVYLTIHITKPDIKYKFFKQLSTLMVTHWKSNVEIWQSFTIFSPHFWLLKPSKITSFLNFLNFSFHFSAKFLW